LPMWVADMDFEGAPEIMNAIKKRLEHPVFGYAKPDPKEKEAVCGWFSRRHSIDFSPEWIDFTAGVIPAIFLALGAFCSPGESVLINDPVYYYFAKAAEALEMNIERSPLVLKNGRYEMDLEDIERRAAKKETKVFILCNPQNPGGRTWSKDELFRIAKICEKHGVFVISDEIHCDLLIGGKKHNSFYTAAKDTDVQYMICASPSKTFNLAGFSAACTIIPDEKRRASFRKYMEKTGGVRPPILSMTALRAAYESGEGWLDSLLLYLEKNLSFAEKFISENLPKAKIMRPEATYLLWLDISAYGDPKELSARIMEKGRLWLDTGEMFGKGGAGFERINIACPKCVLEEGLMRLKKALLDE